jgi:hypothetical protein
MWTRFTERARRAVFWAQEEATRLNTAAVDTEHLLLGILREADDSAAGRVLTDLGVSPARVRATLERTLPPGDATADALKNMQLSARAKRVIDLSYEEAREQSVAYIGSEHLLLGLLREPEGMAGEVLRSLGADLERARAAARRIGAGESSPAAPAPAAPPRRAQDPTGVPSNPGDLGLLEKTFGDRTVEMVTDEAAVPEYREAWRTRDHHAWRALVDAGRVLLVPSGTFAKFLAPHAGDGALLRVRLLDGERAGTAGFVSGARFRRIGPDERPFPPSGGAEMDRDAVQRVVGEAAAAVYAETGEAEAEGVVRSAGAEGGGYIQLTRLSVVPSPVRVPSEVLRRFGVRAGDVVLGYASPPQEPAQLWQMRRIVRVNGEPAVERDEDAAPDHLTAPSPTLDALLTAALGVGAEALHIAAGLPPVLVMPGGALRRREGARDLTASDVADVVLPVLTADLRERAEAGETVEFRHALPDGTAFRVTVFFEQRDGGAAYGLAARAESP